MLSSPAIRGTLLLSRAYAGITDIQELCRGPISPWRLTTAREKIRELC